MPQPQPSYLRWITASQGSKVRFVTVDRICYFQADNKYTIVMTADSELLIRRPIKELDEALDPTDVLADPPLDAGQRQRDRRRDTRPPRAHARAAQEPEGVARGERNLQPPLPPDVGRYIPPLANVAASTSASARAGTIGAHAVSPANRPIPTPL